MYPRIQAAISSPEPLRRLLDFMVAQVLFSLPLRTRKWLFAGEVYYCPICETSLRVFLRLHRAYNLWCPVCRSLARHRLVWLFFERRKFFVGDSNQAMLHFAPEIGLVERFAKIPHLNYVCADLQDPFAMVKMDISDIQYPDCTYDLIYCSHVLEHVPDDKQALREIWRVLKPNGNAVIIVPITTTKTIEDPSISDPVKREELFGQHDHVRRYGPDFKDRLAEVGFEVELIRALDIFPEGEIKRMGLDQGDIIFNCSKRV